MDKTEALLKIRERFVEIFGNVNEKNLCLYKSLTGTDNVTVRRWMSEETELTPRPTGLMLLLACLWNESEQDQGTVYELFTTLHSKIPSDILDRISEKRKVIYIKLEIQAQNNEKFKDHEVYKLHKSYLPSKKDYLLKEDVYQKMTKARLKSAIKVAESLGEEYISHFFKQIDQLEGVVEFQLSEHTCISFADDYIRKHKT